MGLLDSALGGLTGQAPKSSGGGTTTQSAYNLLPQNIQDAVNSYFSQAQQISQTPYQAYTGQTVAPLSGLENQANAYVAQNAGQTANTIGGYQTADQNLLNEAQQGPTAANLQQYMDPYQQDVTNQAKTAAIQNYQQTTLPQINNAAATNGAFGGSRQAVLQANANKNLNTNLSNIDEQGLQQAYTNAQTQFQNSLQNQNTAINSGVTNALTGQNAVTNDFNLLSSAGKSERGVDQATDDQGYTDYLNQQAYPANQLNVLGTALSNTSSYFAPYSTQSAGSVSTTDELGNIAGQAGRAYMLGFAKGGKVSLKGYADGGSIDDAFNDYEDSQDPTLGIGDDTSAPGGWQQLLSGTNLGKILGIGDGSSNTAGDIAGSLKGSAQGYADQKKAEADYQKDLDDRNVNTLNTVGGRLSNIKFNNITSPYADILKQANALQTQDRQHLFSDGGYIGDDSGQDQGVLTPYAASLFNYLKEGGKQLVQGHPIDDLSKTIGDNTVGPILDYLFNPSPDTQAAVAEKRAQAASLKKPSMQDQVTQALQPDPNSPPPLNIAPSPVSGSVYDGDKTLSPEQQAAFAMKSGLPSVPQVPGVSQPTDQMAPGTNLPAASNQTNQTVADLKNLMAQLGIGPQKNMDDTSNLTPLQSIGRSLVQRLGAVTGGKSTSQLLGEAAYQKGSIDEDNSNRKMTDDEQKNNIAGLAELEGLGTKRDYNDVVRDQTQAAMQRAQDLLDLKTQMFQQKASGTAVLSPSQKSNRQLALLKLASDPTADPSTKAMYFQMLSDLDNTGGPATTAQPAVIFNGRGKAASQ